MEIAFEDPGWPGGQSMTTVIAVAPSGVKGGVTSCRIAIDFFGASGGVRSPDALIASLSDICRTSFGTRPSGRALVVTDLVLHRLGTPRLGLRLG